MVVIIILVSSVEYWVPSVVYGNYFQVKFIQYNTFYKHVNKRNVTTTKLRNKQFNNHNKQDKNNQNIAMASWIKIFVHPCVRVYMLGKVYWVNVSIVGRSRGLKKMTLLTYMCMRACLYVRDQKYEPLVFLSPHVRFLWSLATMSRVSVVGKRTPHASSLRVLCSMPFCYPSLRLVVECPS